MSKLISPYFGLLQMNCGIYQAATPLRPFEQCAVKENLEAMNEESFRAIIYLA